MLWQEKEDKYHLVDWLFVSLLNRGVGPGLSLSKLVWKIDNFKKLCCKE
jgi:hypothetical protein